MGPIGCMKALASHITFKSRHDAYKSIFYELQNFGLLLKGRPEPNSITVHSMQIEYWRLSKKGYSSLRARALYSTASMY